MKKTLLLFTGLLMGLTTVSATTSNYDVGQKKILKHKNRFAQPIMFIERGVEFLIFPDGSFDFNTNYYDPYYNDNTYYKSSSRRSSLNVNYRGPNVNIGYSNGQNGVYISRDRFGQVRRVGNVFINYNRRGQVSRVGSVYIDYGRGRHATLRQVGGLRVHYNDWGEITNVRGQVNRFNDTYCNVNGWPSTNTRNDIEICHNDWYEGDDYDDNYYYYKSNGKVKKQKKRKH
ncbi:hypothetical protein KFZ70_13765 [Tamlana fucoidanivorans]|uniref:Right-handed parallel beta-helix repeat-containing protein n=1 Tax=Allotamlana fucoidanivorans TaxID=2583814 RepID=A0A5C4SQL2_9FLAO|nr:hypothetical protein [Tamlana fucoidanivorans]TNJ46494.1 hypothetical protein FGF67_02380 [Tamlana fucoidanivorans]